MMVSRGTATGLMLLLAACSGELSGVDAASDGAATGTAGSGNVNTTSNAGAGATSTSGASSTGDPGFIDQPGSGVTGVTRLARLTHSQYGYTVQDLFGISDDVESGLAPDALDGFDFDTSVDYRVDGRLGPQYRTLAEELAGRAISDSSIWDRIMPCQKDQADCARTFIETFGQRAFRRPLTDAETSRFVALFERGDELVGSGDSFADGVRLVIEAMLQAPQFLYRVELSQDTGADGLIALDAWELASRLSYFLHDSMPTEELFEKAAASTLQTPEQLAAAAAELLNAPEAVAKLVSFHEQAWQFDRFSNIAPDAAIYPDAPSDVVTQVRAASVRFVGDIIENGGGLSDLLTAPYAFANASLAPLYAEDVSGDELSRIDFDPAERKGYLMQVGFLASNAYAIKTDPIHRGLFVLRQLLCKHIPDPPPGASMTELPDSAEPPETTRDEVSLLTGQPACAGCHTDINAAGFAFEAFDAVGQLRTTENGVAVDTTGQLTLDGQIVPFSGATELVDALAASAEARRCYSQKWLEFAQGRGFSTEDQVARDALSMEPMNVTEIAARITTLPAFSKRIPNEVAP